MRRTNLVLGVTLLLLAAAVAVYTTGGSGESAHAHPSHGSDRGPTGSFAPTRPAPGKHAAKSPPSLGGRLPAIQTLHVEPFSLRHPAIEAQALRVETGALNRLEELIDDLDLTESQQVDIFPLLARSHPDYSANLRLVGVRSGPHDPMGRLAAEKQIYKLLDPDQQLDLELKSIETEAWWTDVIARLEKDLKDSTKTPVSTGTAPPEDDPAPPKDDPPSPPAVVPATPHRGNNLFDLLQEGGS